MRASEDDRGNIVVTDDKGHSLVYTLQNMKRPVPILEPEHITNRHDLTAEQEIGFINESHIAAVRYAVLNKMM